VDVILFGGDLFHARGTIHVQTWNMVYDAITRMRLLRSVGLLVGNHDQSTRAGDIHSVYGLSTIATIMDKPAWYEFQVANTKIGNRPESLHVLALPYSKDRDGLVAQARLLADASPTTLNPTLMLGHFGVSGAKVGSNFVLLDQHLLTLADIPYDKVDQTFLGHYHEPQELLPNVRYIGATHHHNWGDVGSMRGCWLWDTAERQTYSEPALIPLAYPEFRVLSYGTKLTRDLVEGHFIKMQAQAVPSQTDIDTYTREATSLGARSFEITWEAEGTQTVSTTAFQPGMDTEAMLEAYVEEVDHEVTLDGAQLIQLGVELLKASA
jgi:DNA repair exonuclease SbcCD nuclease subunit